MAKQTRAEFAQKIKAKYPQYESMDDNELVDKITAKYPQYLDQIEEGKIDAPQDGALESEDTSSVSQDEHNARAQAIQDAAFRFAPQVPEFLRGPMLSFVSTVAETGAGAVQALEKLAYRRAQSLVEDGKVEAQGKVFSDEEMEDMTPAEKIKVFEEWSLVGDDIADSVEAVGQGVKQYGSGSITKELASGNYANAAAITADQTAAGIASLVPFMVPGGAVIGPAVLGASAGNQEFEENLERKNVTMNQIYNASYATAGNEFVWELVTAKILGRAGKMMRGGASAKAASEFAQKAWKRIAGDSTLEGFSEGITDTGSRLIDKYFFGDEIDVKEATVGFIDAAIVGAIVGGKVSTFGEVANPGTAQRVAAQRLKTPEQQQESADRAKTVEQSQEIIDELNKKGTEKSLVDEATLEAAEKAKQEAIDEEVAAEKEHIDTLNDMTETELKDYAVEQDKAKKLEAERKKVLKKNEDTDTTVIDNAIQEARHKANVAYQTVANWRQTTAEIDNVVKQNEEVIEEEQAKLDDAKQPQQTAEGKPKKKTQKQKIAEKKSKEKIKLAEDNIKALNKIKDEARPTHADAKTRKRKAKAKPTPIAPTATKPIKDKAKRDEANTDLIATITDGSIPEKQKERAWSDFFKINAPLIDSIARTAANKANTNPSKEIKDRVKSEIAAQIKKNGKFDRKTINNAGQKVYRDIKQEQETVKKAPTEAGLKEELRDIDQQVQDGILDPEAGEILKDDIRAEYGLKVQTTGLTVESEGDVVISPEVEAATQEEKGPNDSEMIAKAMAGKTVDEVVDGLPDNTETVYALLPKSAKTGKAFSGIFKDGNPAVEIWESYFDGSDRQGKDRIRQLKKAIQQRIDDSAADSEATTASEIFDQAMDFLEKPHKAKPRTVKELLPLLGKLKRAFPNTKIIISKAKMMERLIESGQTDAAAAVQANSIKGFVDPNTGEVFMNEDALDYETPIHEFGHIWAKATRASRYEFYRKGIELLKGSSIYNEIFERAKDPKSVYHGLTKNQLEEEVMATAIGRYGEQMFDAVGDQNNWDSWVKGMFAWLGQQLGLQKPFQDMTASEFMNVAVTEIISGKDLVTKRDVEMHKTSMVTPFLEVPSGTTRDYTPTKAPITELDTHGVFKGQSIKNELYTTLNRYWDDIQNGEWIGWTTGVYGKAAAHKFNAKLNARIESKVKTARELVEGEGLQIMRDPRNPGFHVIKKGAGFRFLETPAGEQKAADTKRILQDTKRAIKKALKPYKKPSPYKYSRVDEATAHTLKETLADLDQRGDTLTKDVLDNVAAKVKEVVKLGKDTRKAQTQEIKKRQAEARTEADAMVKESGVDPNISKSEARLLAKKADSWKNKIFGRDALANILSPATNADFYTLLYNLLPKGKGREVARAVLDRLLIKPLEKANIDYLNAKAKMRNNWIAAKAYAMTGNPSLKGKALNKALNDANNMLNTESTVEFAGRKLRNYDVIKVYNYLKDPSTYRSVNATLDNETLDAIVDYVQSNEQVKRFADVAPGVYAGVAAEINAKLDAHGRQTFSKKRINRDQLSPEEITRLEKINGGALPLFATYTPLTSEGQDIETEVDKLLNADQYTMYTVMDGRLKQRTGGGEIILHGNNLDADFDSYLQGPVRTMAFLDFAKNASDFFGSKQMNGMKAAYGEQWSKAMKDSLRRIVTGKNQPAKQNAATRALDKWINRTVGTVMALNTRSAILQLISTSNFIINDPHAVFTGFNATREERNAVKDFLKNSEWAKERGKGKVDLAVDSIFNDDKPGFIDTVLQKGYVLTKLGDKFAITTGGAPFMTGKYKNYLKEGLSKEEAMQKAYADFVAQAEETQQSTRPERLGQSQTTQMGKLILAFANTPMQYNRKMVRAIKDITAPGTDPKRKKQAGRELLYYGAAQNIVFTSLQRLMLPGVSGDVEDEALDWTNSLVNTLLRGIGVWGAVIAGLKDALINASRDKDIFEPLVNIAPAVGTKIRHLRTAVGAKSIYAQSDLVDDPLVYQVASGVNAATNFPADRAVKVVEQVGDSFSSDFEWYQAVLRALGWSRYDLDAPAGGSPLNRLAGDEAGQAHRDGTIEVDPDLSPAERQKTIEHEKQHVRDMDSGKLDYDDNFIYYNNEKYARRDGKIEYNGSWYEEGAQDLPWEQRAYNAEGSSPLKSTKDGESTKRRDKARENVAQQREFQEKYGANRTDQAFLEPTSVGHQVKFGGVRTGDLDPRIALEQTKAQQFLGDWESNPETISRFKEQYPDLATDKALTEGLQRSILAKTTGFKEGEQMNEHHYGRFVPEEHAIRLSDTLGEGRDALEVHERSHAGGLDVLRGAHAADIIGGVKFKDLFGEIDDETSDYVNNPQEVGAYLQQARFDGGFKPGQEVTEDMVKDLIEKHSDKNLLLKGVKSNDKIKELTKAFNEVASVDKAKEKAKFKDKGLKDLYIQNENTRVT